MESAASHTKAAHFCKRHNENKGMCSTTGTQEDITHTRTRTENNHTRETSQRVTRNPWHSTRKRCTIQTIRAECARVLHERVEGVELPNKVSSQSEWITKTSEQEVSDSESETKLCTKVGNTAREKRCTYVQYSIITTVDQTDKRPPVDKNLAADEWRILTHRCCGLLSLSLVPRFKTA